MARVVVGNCAYMCC